MINKLMWLMPMMLLAGCSTAPKGTFEVSPETRLEEAESALYQGEYYRARTIANEILEDDPMNKPAQDLMANILEKEIARHKDLYEESVPEEWNASEKEIEIRNWFDRSEMLLKAKQYDQAIYAAEKVFLYDPDNLKASRLVDEIKREAVLNGKSETLIKSQMINEEMSIRLNRYKKQAQEAIQAGRFGEAKHVVRKLLILSPEDPDGQDLLNQIESRN